MASSAQVVKVALVVSIVSRSVSGISKVVQVAVVDSVDSRSVSGINTGSTSGCG